MAQQDIYYTSSPGWTWNLMQSPNLRAPDGVKNMTGSLKLIKVVLTLSRGTNYKAPIKFSDTGLIVPRGQVTTPNPLTCCVMCEGQTSSSVTVTERNEFVGIQNGYYGDKYSSVPASSTKFEFVFSVPPTITANSIATLVITGGFTGGNTSCISLGVRGWSRCYWVVDGEGGGGSGGGSGPGPGPGPEPPSGVTSSSFSITDLSGASKGGDVLKDYTQTVSVNYSSQNLETITVSGNSHTTVNASTSSITVTARNSNTDYPTVDNIVVTYKYARDDSWTDDEGVYHHKITRWTQTHNITVYFFEKIKREEGVQTINVIARDAADQACPIYPYNYGTNAAKAHNAFKYGSQDLGEFLINNNSEIPISQYFTLDSDSSNIYKITEDNSTVPILFRFFNSNVQTKWSSRGTYKKELNLYLKISCAPNMPGQFSYNWLDRDNSVIKNSNLPEIALINQEDIMVSNLVYTNDSVDGGYCRAFRITFRDYYTKQSYVSYVLDSNDDQQGTWAGKVLKLGDSHYNQLPEKVVMEMVIKPFFYFNDSKSVEYSDFSVTIPQRFIKITDADLLPKLIFPVLSKTEPYTPMMLPDVERFGYEFEDVIVKHWDMLKSKFGIRIKDYDLYLEEYEYWSNYHVERHMILNMGRFVDKKRPTFYDPVLQIRPFIITLIDTPQEKRIYSTSNDSVLCTTLDSMWYRPTVVKGEYLKYFDAERFMQFINKYKPLRNNQIWTVPTELRGYWITTEFWQEKVDTLNTRYVKSMYDWLHISPASNPVVCWVDTEFLHRKGEYFLTNDIKNNLKQNYYDILRGMSSYSKLITHDYLREHKYTHNFLSKFTHDQITYGQGGI